MVTFQGSRARSRGIGIVIYSLALVGATAMFTSAHQTMNQSDGQSTHTLVRTNAFASSSARTSRFDPPDSDNNKGGGADTDEQDNDEVKIAFKDAPDAVRIAALKITTEDSITSVMRDQGDEDITTFEINYKADGQECSATFTSVGDLMDMEKAIEGDKVPKAAIEAVKHHFPDAKMNKHTAVQEYYYEITITYDNRTHIVTVDPAGNIQDDELVPDKPAKSDGQSH